MTEQPTPQIEKLSHEEIRQKHIELGCVDDPTFFVHFLNGYHEGFDDAIARIQEFLTGFDDAIARLKEFVKE